MQQEIPFRGACNKEYEVPITAIFNNVHVYQLTGDLKLVRDVQLRTSSATLATGVRLVCRQHSSWVYEAVVCTGHAKESWMVY